VLGFDLVSNHFDSRIGSRCPWTRRHLSPPSVPPTYIPCLRPVDCIEHWIWREALDYLSGFTQPGHDGAFGGRAPIPSPSLIDIARTHAPTLSLAASQGCLAVVLD
jgi:hypothetical protein